MRKYICLVLCMLTTVYLPAQTKKASKKLSLYYSVSDLFNETSRCYYTPGKYTPEELKNTEILASASSTSPNWSLFIDKPVGVTDEEYNKKVRTYISTCLLVKGEFWENYRKEYLKQFDFETAIEKLKNEAKKDPSVLKNSPYAAYCKEYTDILNGSDKELRSAWEKLTEESSKRNSEPERVMRNFKEKANKPNWAEYAREELVKYGWNNCIIKYRDNFYKIDTEEVRKAFYNLFVKIDEPVP